MKAAFAREFGCVLRPPLKRGFFLESDHSLCWTLLVSLALLGTFATPAAAQNPTTTDKPESSQPADPYKSQYEGYQPDFIKKMEGAGYSRPFYGWKRDEEQMKLSSEPEFFTLNILEEDSRANALVEAGLKKEAQGQFREALKIYQQIIDKYSQAMYRVSRYGVFVPVAQYCQRRILAFPPEDLAFYRTLYDARAREAFEQSRRQYSLLGFSDIAGSMLATSYGGRALLELGNSALDAGHFLAALEHFTEVRDFFPDADLKTPELALKIAYCEKMLGGAGGGNSPSAAESRLSGSELTQLQQVISQAKYAPPEFHAQLASAPHAASDDYQLMPPSADPMALAEPVWKFTLPGTRHDFYVYSQPVVSDNSVIYRHKNVVTCRSILNGEVRWTYADGGRATWQNWRERQFPQEDVLVQDGLVFTTISKAGPSLVALDLVTGAIKWAYGPLAAANEEEARMRFEAAPAGGPRTIYAGYVLDNIEGETHTDSEYGMIAFDSTSGRIHWRTRLCRLAPGKFAGGFDENRRNRIRSFTSPPLYHQGTVYYSTNAGAIVALDSLSGRVKWLARYPYHPGVHDATRQFGRGGELVQHSRVYFRPHSPMLWYNQRPLLFGERLLIAPVDSNMLMCIDRRNGAVQWTHTKANRASAYLLGMTRGGEVAIAYTGRDKKIGATETTGPIYLLNPQTGETTWKSPDLVMHDDQPVMKHYVFGSPTLHYRMNESWFEMPARPHMTRDGRVYHTSFRYVGYPIFGWISNLTCVDLNQRKVIDRRRYYSGEIIARADTDIHENGPTELKAFEESPAKDEKAKARIAMLKEVVADSVPQNAHGPFLPFSRVTFNRYGQPFELRMSARSIELVYDQSAVLASIAGRDDPQADFARAELAVADSRMDEAARLLTGCLERISSEDLDFRAAINQQLYRVHKRLARQAIRAGRLDEELAQVLGMSRTAGTLAEEIETLFAVSEAYQRRGNLDAAARALRTIIATYGHHEYPVAPIAVGDSTAALTTARGVIKKYGEYSEKTLFGRELARSRTLIGKGLPLYLSTVSPLPKTLTTRAGELASLRLAQLKSQSDEFSRTFAALAERELADKPADELQSRLWEYPQTPAAQQALAALLASTEKQPGPETRRRQWQLADAARVGGLELPVKFQARLAAPPVTADEPAIAESQDARQHDFADEEGAARLVLERQGDRATAANLLFLGARVRKRLDNKFLLTAMDLSTGKVAWETEELRLKGKGQEAGFYTAAVHNDLVLVHGLYDVLALTHADGKLRWRYRVPFDFEIQHAVRSGNLLILAGKTETIALYLDTESQVGEVAWQVQERGDLYVAPYFHGDRLVSVRKLPFSVTVRFRATGQLIGRLNLPDLSLERRHPLLETGHEALPAAHHDRHLVVSDGWYYIVIDVDPLAVRWKRLIDNNNAVSEPAMRFAIGAEHLAVLKEDYDKKSIYMLSLDSGDILWQTDAKDSKSPQPIHSMIIDGENLYGIEPHAGQGFYLVGRACDSGELRFREEVTGYQAKPDVTLWPKVYGNRVVVQIADRQNFELRAFGLADGRQVSITAQKGVGPFGVHGRVSATAQNGRLILLSKDKLGM